MPGKAQLGGIDIPELLYLVVVLAIAFLPLLAARRGAPPGGTEGDNDDGGGGGGGRPPQRPPDHPRGGIPLADAEPSRVRLRGHERLGDLVRRRGRRPHREPERQPARTAQRSS